MKSARELYFTLIHLAESVFVNDDEINWAIQGIDMFAAEARMPKYAEYIAKRDACGDEDVIIEAINRVEGESDA